jgi:hypothetical protein
MDQEKGRGSSKTEIIEELVPNLKEFKESKESKRIKKQRNLLRKDGEEFD